ncbi:TonB-dependent receptor [Dawidia soli]|uniref:TonB-dependent receptor n=1 Tax=Dawidia soli TaxID=2782352 RepID=A0AAP2DDT9_9BACT|nr:TonB-dependent receptor [Dawidia soli]MBT1689844.1 TonB-dependent receptor [Dawidia soli]
MKKTLRNESPDPYWQYPGTQVITGMVAFLMAYLSVFQLQADTVHKSERITVSFEQTTLKDAITLLEDKTPYRFFYNHRLIDDSKKVTARLVNVPIRTAVSALLKGVEVDFKIKGDQIILKKKRAELTLHTSTASLALVAAGEAVASASDEATDDFVKYELTVSGKVVAENSDPLPGVSVLVKGTTVGTVTDQDGRYTLRIPEEFASNGVLVFTFIGYARQEVTVNNQTVIDLTMTPDVSSLEEILVIGYGTQKRETVTGSVSAVTSKDLESVHSVTTSSMLAGKLPGLSFRQADGRPGSSASIQIRNMGSPLFVIDGIQKDEGQFNNISPNDIESISILKDASASVYGSRAANGVVIVTTKKGKTGTGNTFSLDAYTGWQNWTRFPKTVNAGEWYTAKVEADVNDGKPASDIMPIEELAKWQAGTEKGYRSFDWYKFIIKGDAPQSSVTLSATGGSEKINYYFSLGRVQQSSVLGREYTFERTNIQTNIGAQVTNRFKISTQINGRIETRDQPGIPGGDDYWLPRFALFRNRPFERPFANDNPNYPNHIQNDETNFAWLNKKDAGYWTEDWRVLQLNFTGEYDTPIKGLKARGIYSYYLADRLMNGHEYTYDTYTYDEPTDTYVRTGGSTNPWRERGTRKVIETVVQGQLDYSHTFNGRHNLSATFVAERINRRNLEVWVHAVPKTNELPIILFNDTDTYNDTDYEEARIGYVGRLSYDYQGKYLFEVAGRRDASWKFAPGKRWGVFPSVSAGWRVSEEPFYRNFTALSNTLTDVKIRASYGLLGDDNIAIGPFDYLTGYRYPASTAILDMIRTGGQVINNTTIKTAYDVQGDGRPITNISWLESRMTDIGIDYGILSGKLTGTLDYFYRKRTGLFQTKEDVLMPSELGYNLAPENLRSDAYVGGEASLAYSGFFRGVTFSVGGNIAYSRLKQLTRYKPELSWGNSWDHYRNNGASTNRWADPLWGLHAVGQFQSQEQIAAYPVDIDGQGNKTLLPGDLIYEDINGDAVINGYDERPIGYSRTNNPTVNYGLFITMGWKNFDFRADFSGGAMYSNVRRWEMAVPFQNGGNLLRELYDDHWHRADPYDPNSAWIPGKYPTMRYANSDHSNYRVSDFWVTNVRYLRLRTMEVGYSIPTSLLDKVKLKKARVYVNTFNLFSIDNVKKYGMEPEVADENGLQYPQHRLVNIGVNISF